MHIVMVLGRWPSALCLLLLCSSLFCFVFVRRVWVVCLLLRSSLPVSVPSLNPAFWVHHRKPEFLFLSGYPKLLQHTYCGKNKARSTEGAIKLFNYGVDTKTSGAVVCKSMWTALWRETECQTGFSNAGEWRSALVLNFKNKGDVRNT